MHDNMVSRTSRDRWIYHFAYLDDIEAIFAAGHLACDLMARDGLTRTEVGDPAIKQSRRQRPVLAGPGGQVGDYVPFYFATRSPMMYRIACEHRDGRPLQLVDGFETPYSLELLATVHFASVQPPPTADPGELVDRVASWSLRKARMFTDKQYG